MIKNIGLTIPPEKMADFYLDGVQITQMLLDGVIVWDIGGNKTIIRGWLTSTDNTIVLNGLTSYTITTIYPSIDDFGNWSFPSGDMATHYNQSDVVGTIDWGDGTTDTYHSGCDNNGDYQYATHTYSDDYVSKNTQDNGVWVDITIDCDIKYISNYNFITTNFILKDLEIAESVEITYSSLLEPHYEVTKADTQLAVLPTTSTILTDFVAYSNILNLVIPQNYIYLGLQGCYCQVPITFFNNYQNYRDICANCEKLDTVTIEGNIKLIGYGAFQNCYNLKNVNLPESLECIGTYAFYYCYYLDNIILPSSLKYIHARAFFRVNDISGSKTDSYNEYLDNPIDVYKSLDLDTKIDVFKIPDYVEYIGTEAFTWAYSKTISLPNGIKCIGTEFFRQTRSNCNDIFYRGTVSDWFNIVLAGEENTNMSNYEYLYLASRISQKTWYDDNSSSVNRIICDDGIIINPYTEFTFTDGTTMSDRGYKTGDDCFDSSGEAIKDNFCIL